MEVGSLVYSKKNDLIYFYLDLTKNGSDNIDKVIEALYSALNTIKEDKNIEILLNNFKAIAQIKFKLLEEKKTVIPADIDNLLKKYDLYGKEEILGNLINDHYSKDKIDELLNKFNPENSFILIDSPYEIKSEYLTSSETVYTKSYKSPYKINKIPEDLLNKLKTIKAIDEYEFKPRDTNEDYTKNEDLTEEPCYKTKSKKCEYNEYNPDKPELKPYTLVNSSNILSLVKIDRSFGIPFVKGYIDLELDNDRFKSIVNNEKNSALYYLLQSSLNHKFSKTSLYDVGTTISIEPSLKPNIKILFSTYNDLVNKVIEFIIDFFKDPIDEITFNTVKELYYSKKSENFQNTFSEVNIEIEKLFKRFVTVDTYKFEDFSLDDVKESDYSNFTNMFTKINETISKLKYLTYGDISVNLANSTTEKLSSLIKEQEINLKLNIQKYVDIPEKTSIIYSYVPENKYERQGVTFVMYEFEEKLYEKMHLYQICADNIFFDYLRSQRGSGYIVTSNIRTIEDQSQDKIRYYFSVFCLGKVYSTEKMDRLINEAIKESFKYKFPIDLIRKHLKNKEKLRNYPQERFEDLIKYLYPVDNNTQNNSKDNNDEKDENMTYESIVESIQDTLVNKPKRIAIYYHRGDLTPEELEEQNKELDPTYYLNTEIKNEVTTNLTYLEKYLKSKIN